MAMAGSCKFEFHMYIMSSTTLSQFKMGVELCWPILPIVYQKLGIQNMLFLVGPRVCPQENIDSFTSYGENESTFD